VVLVWPLRYTEAAMRRGVGARSRDTFTSSRL